MQELLNELLEKAKSNKKGLVMLKECAVRCQQFDLAAQLRQMEKDFPHSEEVKEAIKYSNDVKIAFSMVELKVDEETCWLIGKTIKKHIELGGQFSVKDAAELLSKRDELFINISI